MIKSLQIRNYAIIDELEIKFSKGLTIITGETGAGKSILLGALGLIMGRRADTKTLYNTEKKCVIEGIFDVSKYQIDPFFDEHDLDREDELIVRREITPSGKSRAFVNDTPVNLKVLQDLSRVLVDLHQQFDTHDIHQAEFQMQMLDALADNRDLLAEFQDVYRTYKADQVKLNYLIEKRDSANRELQFLQHNLEEFHEAQLVADEQATLEENRDRQTHAEDIKRVLAGAYQELEESENALISRLEGLTVAINQIGSYDSRVSQLSERFNGVLLELRDVANEFESLADSVEFDPQTLEEIQERLDLIYRLQSKHQVQSVDELLKLQAKMEEEAGEFADIGGAIQDVSIRIEREEKLMAELCKKMHAVV